jgi:hypothetical protein
MRGTNFWSTTRIGYVCMDVKFVQKEKHRSKRLPSKGPVNVRSLEINTPEQDIQDNRQADNRKATEPDCAGHFRYLPKSLSADSRKERVKRYFVTGERAESKYVAGNKAPDQYR